ncbi:MAG: hypothetical protein AAFQ94_17300 [Bacteroidota bacterium]
MKTKFLLTIVVLTALISCEKKRVSFDDANPPSTSLVAYQQGMYNKAQVDDNAASAELLVGIGEPVYLLAAGLDTMGLKKVTIEAVSGGLIRQEGTLSASVSVENDTTRNQSNEIVSPKNAVVIGDVEFNQPDQPVVMRATSEDWAGNVSITPTIVIRPLPLPVARISANRTRIDRGDPVTLTYESENADEVLINGVTQSRLNGQQTINPNFSADYILEVKNQVGTARDTVTVEVTPPPAMPNIRVFNVNPTNLEEGEDITITWDVQNATHVTLFRNGSVLRARSTDVSGSVTVGSRSPGNYVIRILAEGNGGTDERSRNVTVREPAGQPAPDPTYDCEFILFQYVNSTAADAYWVLNLGNVGGTAKEIRRIDNTGGTDIRLIVSGRDAIIPAGGSSNVFNGLTMRNNFTAIVGNPNGLATLKFCFDD